MRHDASVQITFIGVLTLAPNDASNLMASTWPNPAAMQTGVAPP